MIRPLLHLIATGLLCAACASAPPAPVATGAFEPLAAGEGFLVVQIDTEVAIERVRAGRLTIARDLQAGQFLWLVRAEEGRYRYSQLLLVLDAAEAGSGQTFNGRFPNDDEFQFQVVAGKINYPGHLLIQFEDRFHGPATGIAIRNRNHSAMAIRKLLKSHPEIVAAHPLHYAGTSGDEFLDVYSRLRDRVRSPRAEGTSAKPPAPSGQEGSR